MDAKLSPRDQMERAKQIRSMAEGVRDEKARRVLLKLSEMWERLAERASRRNNAH